ncbi:MAG: tetratricopeptide repeat protein [Bacteroidales bacterium]|nr:tetratricopeptide repeat protein [Bacteroidales bacterium]
MRSSLPFFIFIFLLCGTGANAYSLPSDPDSLKNILQTSDNDSVRMKAAKEILINYVRSKEYDKAEAYALEFHRLAAKTGTNELLGKAYYNLGIVKWLQGMQAVSNAYFKKSVPYLTATPDSVLLAKCYTKIGTNYLRLSNFSNALHYYELSATIRAGLNDSTKWANNLINIAGCYYQMAEYDEAITYYHKALRIAEKTGNLKLKAYNFNNIGNIYLKTEDYPNAIAYLLNALEANRKLHNDREVSKNLLNLANAYQNTGGTELAKKYYLESAGIKENLNDQEGLSETYNSLGLIYKNLGDPDKALAYYQKAFDLIRLTNDRFAEASVLTNIGTVHLSKGSKAAAAYFLNSLDIARQINARHLVLTNYNSLVEYYLLFGEFEKSVAIYEQIGLLNDSIYNDITAHAIAEMQTKYETEKKERKNELLLKDIQLQKVQKRFLFVAISALVLLLLATVYSFSLKSKSLKQSKLLYERVRELRRMELAKKEAEKEHLEDKVFAEKQLNRLQREKHRAEIEQKNNELVNSALCIVNKNEALTNIKAEILTGSKAKGNEDFIPDLIRLINNNIDIDQNWQKFKLSFEKVHPGFFDKLNRKHPGLSETYIRLTAYIRIRLTTSESAQLLNVTVASVKKSRQRLRKKFGLDTGASLFEFVASI